MWDNVRAWRWAAGVFATLSLALLVAAVVARDPPDFSDMSIVAVVRDGETPSGLGDPARPGRP